MKNISIIKCFFAFISLMTMTSCSGFLDIVPDNTVTLDDVFNSRVNAFNALAKVYSFLPDDNFANRSTFVLGDEFMQRLDYNNNAERLRGIRIMRGLQSAANPIMGAWVGTQSGKPWYQAIRQCNMVLDRIDEIPDMEQFEKEEWKGQVLFLKAYYHWLLLQRYGPIIISDQMVSPEAMSDELYPFRNKVEDCFDYILRLMDDATPKLQPFIQRPENYGMIDQTVAKSIKARILLYRARPFYNGNMEYYGDFMDFDGKPYFSLEYDREKWKKAIDAIEGAIQTCENFGKKLYTWDNVPYWYDANFFERNAERLKLYWTLRMVVCDPWNSELIWGKSNVDRLGAGAGESAELGAYLSMRCPNSAEFVMASNKGNTTWNAQMLGISYQVMERYYTENGLPIDEDLTYPYYQRNTRVMTPDPNVDPEAMVRWLGIFQPYHETIQLNMGREMRYYANLAITGGYWRGQQELIPLKMYWGTYGGGGVTGADQDCFQTGIGSFKLTHPLSGAETWRTIVFFPYPWIRMADLYLMKAEAYNEYEGPSQTVYDAINKVRIRAGIPTVEESWGDPKKAATVDKHKSQLGMRDIILHERSIEFAFEGSRFWDMVHYKKAPQEFSKPIWGWNHTGRNFSDFYVLDAKQSRVFTVRDCLWPIDIAELNINQNLKQNPGW